MNNADFTVSIERMFERCRDLLVKKGDEYAGDEIDRLHNFKKTASLRGVSPRKALAGMMVKHTVSIYDMLESDAEFSAAQWDEKIGDNITYLLLLCAILDEDRIKAEVDDAKDLVDLRAKLAGGIQQNVINPRKLSDEEITRPEFGPYYPN